MPLDRDPFVVTVSPLVDDLSRAPYAQQKPVRPGPEAPIAPMADREGLTLARRGRGRHHTLVGTDARVGRGGADRDRYVGCQLLVTAADPGPVTDWRLGPANRQARWLAGTCRCWRFDPAASPGTPAQLPVSHRRGGGSVGVTGPVGPRQAAGFPSRRPPIADRGFTGATGQPPWASDSGVPLVTHASDGDHATAARRQHRGWRQTIETVNRHLERVERVERVLHLAYPSARSLGDLRTRIAATIAAFNLGVLINHQLDRPPFAFATLCPF